MIHPHNTYFNHCSCNSCTSWKQSQLATDTTDTTGAMFKALYSLCVFILGVCMFLLLTACEPTTTEYCSSDFCIKEGETLEQISIDKQYL